MQDQFVLLLLCSDKFYSACVESFPFPTSTIHHFPPASLKGRMRVRLSVLTIGTRCSARAWLKMEGAICFLGEGGPFQQPADSWSAIRNLYSPTFQVCRLLPTLLFKSAPYGIPLIPPTNFSLWQLRDITSHQFRNVSASSIISWVSWSSSSLASTNSISM